MNEQTAAQTPENDSPATARIHVIATTLEGTRAALVVAKRLTAGVHAPIRLIIPVLTSFLGRIDPDYNGTAVIEEHQAHAGRWVPGQLCCSASANGTKTSPIRC